MIATYDAGEDKQIVECHVILWFIMKRRISNYRLISILPFFTDLFEKATGMYNRLNNYITKLQILNPNQYGFRKNNSTQVAIKDMCNNITKSLVHVEN